MLRNYRGMSGDWDDYILQILVVSHTFPMQPHQLGPGIGGFSGSDREGESDIELPLQHKRP